MENNTRKSPKLVQVPSPNFMTEKDVVNPPILECINLGIRFGGLAAVEGAPAELRA